MANAGGSRLEVIRADDANAAQIAEFIQLVWDGTATPESVVAARAEGAKRNTVEPGVAPPTYIALQAGRVLGYVTSIPIRLWDGERDWGAYWIKGLMVHPEFRNGPIGYLLLKAATKLADALPVVDTSRLRLNRVIILDSPVYVG